nr:MAG TPA: hypothetical protein [Caudoviricetes sp.]
MIHSRSGINKYCATSHFLIRKFGKFVGGGKFVGD